MSRPFMAVSVAALALIGMASAQGAEPASAPSAQPVDRKSELICYWELPRTGSRLGVYKMCKTQKDWDALHATSRDYLNDVSKRALQLPAM